MAIPPKGDPQRPLHLAASSATVLGLIGLALTVFVLFVTTPSTRSPNARHAWVVLMVTSIYAVPGILFLIFAIFLKRRKFWAIVGCLVLSSIALILGSINLAIFLYHITTGTSEFSAMSLGIPVLVVAAFAQLDYHLYMSFEAIKYAPVEQQRGFDPLISDKPAMSPPPLPPK